ncbi:MAG TPA: hypothetical protein VJR58_19865 [Vineibacter sp.]|nr:hypothetical protein [Vineibacter sp.]
MSDVLSAFPRRPMRILRTGVPSVIFLGFLALFVLALGVGMAVWMTPGILRDLEIGKNPVEEPQARISNGKCRSKLVLVTCEANIAYAVAGKRYATHVEFSFVDVHFGDYTANVVRSATKPELATLDIGLEAMWNRIGTLIGFLALFLGGAVALALNAVRNMRLKAIAKSTDRLTPVIVGVTQIAKNMFGKNVTCAYAGTGRVRKFAERLRKTEEPFFLSANQALAVLPGDATTPILVDEALSRLDLTDAERHALYAARQRGTAAPAGWPQATPAR